MAAVERCCSTKPNEVLQFNAADPCNPTDGPWRHRPTHQRIAPKRLIAKMPWSRKVTNKEKGNLLIGVALCTVVFGIGALNGGIFAAWLLLIAWAAFIAKWNEWL